MRGAGIQRRVAVAVGAVALVAAVAVGCGSNTQGLRPDEDGPPTTAAVAPQNFSQRGSYAAGVTRLSLGTGQAVNVFYPADRAAVAADATAFRYTPEDTLGSVAKVLTGLATDVTVPDAWVDVPASTKGPFPLVVFSHGRGGTRFDFSFHAAHLASWGIVVALVDHPNRNLEARLTGKDVGTSDVTAVLAVIDLIDAQNRASGGRLTGRIAMDRVAVEGHSAGGRDAGLAASDPRVKAWISLSGAPPVPEAATGGRDVVNDGNGGFDPAAGEFDLRGFLAATPPPPAKPAMMVVADNDVVYPVPDRRAVFDWLQPPKRWVVLAETGHVIYTDSCEGIQKQGGLDKVADALGLSRDSIEIQLAADGCLPSDGPVAPRQAAWNHLEVAQLRWAFGIDAAVADASLQRSYLDATFPGVIKDYVAVP